MSDHGFIYLYVPLAAILTFGILPGLVEDGEFFW